MTQKSYKFGSADKIRFIELYSSYDCLWNAEHKNYNNRNARNAALCDFARKLGIEDFGPKEITVKIKNMRSQYLQERKKVRSSIEAGAEAENIYVSKLPWYNALDRFLGKNYELRTPIKNLLKSSTPDICYSKVDKSNNINTINSILDLTSKPIKNNTLVEATRELKADERSREHEDELVIFGKYVTSSLRKLNQRNVIYAQNEIQMTITKFKLRNLKETTATPMPESPVSRNDTDIKWWNAADDSGTEY